MASSRRSERQSSSLIWPGFVDAMTALLMVLMFVLSIFMIVQFVLREEITGKDRSLADLNQQMGLLNTELTEAEKKALAAQTELTEAQKQVLAFQQELSGLESLLATERTQRGALETRLSEQEAARAELQSELTAAMTNIESLQSTLTSAQSEQEQLSALVAALTEERDSAAAELAGLSDMQSALSAAQSEAENAQTALSERDAALAALRAKLEQAAQDAQTAQQSELTLTEKVAALELELDKKRKDAEETLLLLAAAETRQKELEAQKAQLSDEARAALEAAEAEQAAALETMSRREMAAMFARAQLQNQQESSTQDRKAIALLNQQLRAMRRSSEQASAELSNLRAQLAASELRGDEQDVTIAELGSRLNRALAERVSELQNYRSEFFGRMRSILGNRDGIRVVGDRFVFESEVLFDSASADLNPQGQQQISAIASAIRELSSSIPEEVDWLLRVDGHTDRIPLQPGAQYRNNWELSQARALSVVEYLIDNEGIDPKRLAATGFGEFQPLDPGLSREALARNRRIEFKLTER
ncbi:MAG: OmpA family protein [Neomegalonema sp.]|nr:OmpA family protein [Neomegalonema sp.]